MDSLVAQATWPFCSAVISSVWLERRREFAYLYFLQCFCGRGMVMNGDCAVSFVFCLSFGWCGLWMFVMSYDNESSHIEVGGE